MPATTSATIGPNGTIVIATSNGFQTEVTSAKIDAAGGLTRAGGANYGLEAVDSMAITDDGHVMYGNGNDVAWTTLATDGTFGSLKQTMTHSCRLPAMLAPNVLVSSFNDHVAAFGFDDAGQLTDRGHEASQNTLGTTDAVTVHGDIVVSAGISAVSTYRYRDGTLESLHRVPYTRAFNAVSLPPFVSADGTVIVAQRYGTIDTFAMSSSGELRHSGQVKFGREIAGTPIAFGKHMVVAETDGTLRSFALDGGDLRETGQFATDGMISARPTITRDGTVLIGDATGKLYAVNLGSDGSLRCVATKQLDGAIETPVTVTADGFVLVSAGNRLLTLKD